MGVRSAKAAKQQTHPNKIENFVVNESEQAKQYTYHKEQAGNRNLKSKPIHYLPPK